MRTYVLDARTVTPHFPGIGRYVRQLAQMLPELLEPDERLVLLTGAAWQPKDNSVACHAVADSPFSLGQQWRVPRLLRELNTTVYHSPYLAMPYRPGVPTLLTVYDLIPLDQPQYSSPRARLLWKGMMRLALRAADKAVSISHATTAGFQATFGVSPEVVWLGIGDNFRPISPNPIHEKFNLPEQYVLYFGSNKPHKNIVGLIRAWKQCAIDGIPLVVAGAWYDQFPEAKQLAAQLPADSVRFLGRIEDDDLPALYSGATVFAFLSESEGFGFPPLEAMACGTPVLCSNVSSLPEVVGDAAITVSPTDIDAIAAALKRMLGDADLRRKLRAAGLARAATFQWQTTAAATLNLYRSLANEV